MQPATKRSLWEGAASAVLSAPVAAGLTALVWQFPIAIAGTAGHSVGAAIAASVTMVAFMTLFSIFGGVLALGLVGAGAGYLVRHLRPRAPQIAGIAVGCASALVVAVADVFLTGG